MEKLNNLIQSWIYRLSKAGSLSSDTEEQQLRKAVVIFLASTYSILGLLWGFVYLAVNLPLASIFPIG